MDKLVTAAFDSEEKTMAIDIQKIGVIGSGQMGSGIYPRMLLKQA